MRQRTSIADRTSSAPGRPATTRQRRTRCARASAPPAGLEGLAAQAKLVAEGRAEPMQGLSNALDRAGDRSGARTAGRSPPTTSISCPSREVAQHRPEGSAWGSDVVYLVTAAP